MFTYKKIGKTPVVHSKDVVSSPVGIGLEKLDRDVFDPTDCFAPLGELGVKWVRIQSGWQKTEQQKGVYDFGWLDYIVDNIIANGMTPWMCLCYGNILYDERCEGLAGGMGCPPIHSDDMKRAWTNYCKAVAHHYKGRVAHFEVWNEPDGQWCWRHGVSGTEYGIFARDTALAVKEGNPDAEIFAGAFCGHNLSWLNDALKNMALHIDAVTYHDYSINPEYNQFDGIEQEPLADFQRNLRSLLDMYNPNIDIIQGETGTHSQYALFGAVEGCNWTEDKQTKLLLRRMLSDYKGGVRFASYFTAVDMFEPMGEKANKKREKFGFYGVLGAEFDDDENFLGTYYKKPSYYALQTLSALLCNGTERTNLPIQFSNTTARWQTTISPQDSRLNRLDLKLADGRGAMIYWVSSDILTESVDTTLSLRVVNMGTVPQLVDLADGSIYEIGEEHIKWINDTDFDLIKIKTTDSPLMLLF